MKNIQEGTLLWEPSAEQKANNKLNDYMNWLQRERNLSFDNYNKLWQWSVTELEDFWESIWQYFNIQAKTPYQSVLTSRKMPGAKWFTGATLNYTEHIFRNRNFEETAIVHTSE